MALFEPVPTRRSIAMQAVLFAVWVAVTGVGAWLKPNSSGHGTHTQLGLPPCPSVYLFGRPCPGCGMTTSWTNFIHGHLAAALHAHPLGPLMYVLFTIAAILAFIGFCRKQRFSIDSPRTNFALVGLLVVFFGFGIIRMVTVTNYMSISDITALHR